MAKKPKQLHHFRLQVVAAIKAANDNGVLNSHIAKEAHISHSHLIRYLGHGDKLGLQAFERLCNVVGVELRGKNEHTKPAKHSRAVPAENDHLR